MDPVAPQASSKFQRSRHKERQEAFCREQLGTLFWGATGVNIISIQINIEIIWLGDRILHFSKIFKQMKNA